MLNVTMRSLALWQWVAAGAEAFQTSASEASGSGSHLRDAYIRICDTYMCIHNPSCLCSASSVKAGGRRHVVSQPQAFALS